MKILITGTCGFIGFNLSNFLIKKGFKISGIDNLNDYYDVKIKHKRLKILKKNKNFKFFKTELSNNTKVKKIFKTNQFDFVIHLAAQAGVRYSIDNPRKYIESNTVGFFNILENCRLNFINNVLFASSSSVYGDKKKFPINEDENLNPKNFYGLTKKNNEEMAEIYSKLYKINIHGLRFFTVYGEWGRPDMFMLKYLNARKKFDLFNNGNHYRDFTYIKDVNKIIEKLIKKKLKGYDVFNICSNNSVKITTIIKFINKNLDKSFVKINKLGLQRADVIKTHGNNNKIKRIINFKKFTPLEKGLESMIAWYKLQNKL